MASCSLSPGTKTRPRHRPTVVRWMQPCRTCLCNGAAVSRAAAWTRRSTRAASRATPTGRYSSGCGPRTWRARRRGSGTSSPSAESSSAAPGPRPFEVDPVPRLIDGAEWGRIESGLKQRCRALNAFLADAYDERRIVAEGVMPARLIDGAEWFEPAMASGEDWTMPAVVAHVAGPDLVRGADGRLRVLEDNLRAPSGLTFALAARDAMASLIEASGLRPRPLGPVLGALERTLASAAPAGVEDPRVVLLTDGPSSVTFYEHEELSRVLGLPLATPGGPAARRRPPPARERRRRSDRRRLPPPRRRAADARRRHRDAARRAPDRADAAGTLGVRQLAGQRHRRRQGRAHLRRADDRLLPRRGRAPARRCPGGISATPNSSRRSLPRIGELVIKPRGEFGGRGVVIGPLASAAEREEAAAAVRRGARALRRPGAGRPLRAPDRDREWPAKPTCRPATVRPLEWRGDVRDARRPDPVRSRRRERWSSTAGKEEERRTRGFSEPKRFQGERCHRPRARAR